MGQEGRKRVGEVVQVSGVEPGLSAHICGLSVISNRVKSPLGGLLGPPSGLAGHLFQKDKLVKGALTSSWDNPL